MRFLTHRVYAELSAAFFSQISFCCHFGGYLEFLRKTQKHIYLGNSARYSGFDENFGPQGTHRVIWHSCEKAYFCHFLQAG